MRASCAYLFLTEDVADRELAGREHEPVLGLGLGKLIEVALDLLDLAAEVDGLPEERPLNARERIARPFAVVVIDEAGDPVKVAERKALIDFGIDPDLCAAPGSEPSVDSHVRALAAGI